MKPTQLLSATLAAVIGSTLIFLTGCQSGAFTKPDLGKLAFWKKDDVSLASRGDEVPPPSAHFNPDKGDQKLTGKEQIQASVDAIIAEAKRNKENPQEPIRKPYSLDSIDSKIGNRDSKKESNDFVLSKKLNQIQSATNNALQATENTVKQTGAIVENTANALSGSKNNLQSNGENQISKVANNLNGQATNVLSNTTDVVDSLAKTTTATFDQSVSTVKNSINNSFQPNSNSQSTRVANPYLGSTQQAKSETDSTSPTTEVDVASNDKQNPSSSNVNFLRTQSDNTSVQQSSFDSTFNRNTPAILQPVRNNTIRDTTLPSASGSSTTYPSTPFGVIRPVNHQEPSQKSTTPEIPAQLLQGTSSFSPGSTATLKSFN